MSLSLRLDRSGTNEGPDEDRQYGKHGLLGSDRSAIQWTLSWIRSLCSSRGFLYPLFAVLIAMGYYYYLHYLYAVDEVYDGDKLREWSIDEMLTIRVSETTEFQDIKKFVEKYSLCQCVHEIQVVWRSAGPLPTIESNFTFAHTHSKVSFDRGHSNHLYTALVPSLPISTEGIDDVEYNNTIRLLTDRFT